MTQIVWLASYPRSGNTWLRVFLSNLAAPDDTVADINNLAVSGSASDRAPVDDALGVESSDLAAEEIDCLRPAAYRVMAAHGDIQPIVKVHDVYRFTSRGEPLFPAEITGGALY